MIVMTDENIGANQDSLTSDDGVIIHASLDLLRKGVERVLVDFIELIESPDGDQKPVGSAIELGDTIVFKENIDNFPAELVATNIGEDLWYVVSTSETPPSGFPTDKDASRAAKAETMRLELLVKFICGIDSSASCETPRDWHPDPLSDAEQILRLINRTKERWKH